MIDMTRKSGVYECEIAQAGHRAFHVVNSHGEVGFIQYPTSWVTPGLVSRLLDDLERNDAVTTLHIVKRAALASPGPSS